MRKSNEPKFLTEFFEPQLPARTEIDAMTASAVLRDEKLLKQIATVLDLAPAAVRRRLAKVGPRTRLKNVFVRSTTATTPPEETYQPVMSRKWTVEELGALLRAGAEVLTDIHAAGDVHCAISPSTVLADESTAVQIHGEPDAGYLAPELEDEADATPQSDQYSLALVVCSVLSGVVYTPETRFHPATPPKFDVLTSVQQAALHRALSFQPNKRFPSCIEFASAFSSR